MKLASLYSGGKDSTYSILRAKESGHEISCLITMHPAADDSPLFHYPNSWLARYLAECIQIPLVEYSVPGRAKEDEVHALEEAIDLAKSLYEFAGILYGGISSRFQQREFEEVCSRKLLTPVAPLWGTKADDYMLELVDRGFEIMIVGVSAMGLGKEWLGKILDRSSLKLLRSLSVKYGFNLNFEGGEAETLVIDCSMYRKRLEVKRSETLWDGQRGIFEIREVALKEKTDNV